MAQIPDAAVGTVVGVLFYSFVCLIGSCLVIWLTCQHREWFSYVAYLSYFTTLATICSIIQQIHTIIFWNDIMTERLQYTKAHRDNPELTLTNASLGLDRVLFYIQYYCYNVEALFVMFWAWALVQSIYRLNERPNLKRSLLTLNRGGKIFAIGFPIILIVLLQVLTWDSEKPIFLILARQPLMWSMGLGGIAILAILVRYIHSRIKLQAFHFTYGHSRSLGTQSEANDVTTSDAGTHVIRKRSIYDQWLLIRFTIAFVVLSIFELSIILFGLNAKKNLESDAQRDTPDISAERAVRDFRSFMPGVTASLLVFVVFGTTRPFLSYMRSCLCGQRKKSSETPQIATGPSRLRAQDSKTSLVGANDIELQTPKKAFHNDFHPPPIR